MKYITRNYERKRYKFFLKKSVTKQVRLKMVLESINVRDKADFMRQSVPQFWGSYLKSPIT